MHIIFSALKGNFIFNFYSYGHDKIFSTYEYTGDDYGNGDDDGNGSGAGDYNGCFIGFGSGGGECEEHGAGKGYGSKFGDGEIRTNGLIF